MTVRRSPWTDRAACNGVDTNRFVIDDKRRRTSHGRNGVYASPVTRRKIVDALAICNACPVRSECEEYLIGWAPPTEAREVWIRANGHTPHGHTRKRTA